MTPHRDAISFYPKSIGEAIETRGKSLIGPETKLESFLKPNIL